MASERQLWPLLLQGAQAIFTPIQEAYRAEIRPLLETAGLQPADFFHFVYLIENFDSQRLSVAGYQRRDPFDHPAVVQGHLERVAAAGLLEPAGEGTYRITEAGLDARQRRWEIANRLLSDVQLLPATEEARLLELLGRVVEATLAAAEPPAKWATRTRQEHGLPQPAGSAPLWQFVQYRMDLGAYRDDAHLAAWREAAVDLHPTAWEALSILWADGPRTPAGLAQQQARRGHDAATYAAALNALAGRGYAQANGEKYTISVAGREQRERIERQTDDWFYAPWETLRENELEALAGYLSGLRPVGRG